MSKIPIKSNKDDVLVFLNKLHLIINSDKFDINKDLILILSNKEDIRYSTYYLLNKLGYNAKDVINELSKLDISNYSETLFDRDDDNPPLLYVFGKNINKKEVYIKIKIKPRDRILCLSFHYAKYKMSYPYKKEVRYEN